MRSHIKTNRRRFLRGFALSAGGLFVPRIVRAAPSLSFFGKSKGGSNGLLNGLLGYWSLDEAGTPATFADATGNGWTGSNHGSITTVAGLIGNCANFPSAFHSQGISVSGAIDNRASSTPFTVGMHIVDLGNGTSGCALIGEWGTRNDWVIFAATGGNDATLRASDDSGTTTDVQINPVPCCGVAWATLVFGFDGSQIFISLNDAAPVTASKSAVRRNGGNFVIGNYQSFSCGWGCRIDEVGYWNRALSAAERTSYHNGGAGLPFSSYTN